MSRVCPQCTNVNPDSIAFCTRCGYRFQGNEQAVSSVPPDADPSATLTPGSQQAQAQVMAANIPSTPAYAPDPNQAQAGFMAPPVQPVQQPSGYQMQMPPVYGQQQPYNAPAAAMPNAGGTLQRAFAGKGKPVRHHSWLIDGKQTQPAILRNTLIENIQKQGVMGVGAIPERLREQGVVMEERDYVRVQYGASSIFVYMAPMGQSLYISRTSTVQQPYSRVRIGVVIGLFILMLLSWLLFAVISPSYSDVLAGSAGFTEGAKTFFGYAFFGLLFVFIFLLLRGLVSWIAEMDFLAFLRPHTLNDFTLDALSAVEQITDKGIRETVKQAGLNPAEITQAQSFALRQPLH